MFYSKGIPIGTDPRTVKLAKSLPLPAPAVTGNWEIVRAVGKNKFLRLPYEHSNLKTGSSSLVNVSSSILDRVEARGVGFSELQSYWSLPFHDFAMVSDVAIFPDNHNRTLYDTVNIVTSNPVMLYSMQANNDKFRSFTLNQGNSQFQ